MFLRLSLPGVVLNCLLEVNSCFYTTMGKSYVPMLMQIVAVPIHVITATYLVTNLSMGIEGTAMAINVTFVLVYAGLMLWKSLSGDVEVQRSKVAFKVE